MHKFMQKLASAYKFGELIFLIILKGLFHPAFLARVVSWLAFVSRHFHDETDPLNLSL